MSTKPYPDLLSASRAKPSQEATAQPEVAVDQDLAEADGSSDAPDEAETEEATGRSHAVAKPTPMFRAPLKYIEIPPDLLAEMEAKPLPRMPTGELYSTRKFDLPPKDEAGAGGHEEQAQERQHDATAARQTPGNERRSKGSLRAGALLALGLLLGGIWIATNWGSEGGTTPKEALITVKNGVADAPSEALPPTSTPTEPTRSIHVPEDAQDTALVEREPQATAIDEPDGSKSPRPAGAAPSAPKPIAPKPSAPPKKPATPPSSDEAVDTKTPFTGL